jgi:hypothetical protein
MRGDPSSRNRSVLLTRWRGALRVVPEPESVVPAAAPPLPAVLVPAPQTANEAELFELFEAEIRCAVAQPMADAILRMLSATRAAVLAERSQANCLASLAQLDWAEDILDAVLLADRASSEGAPGGRQPQ